MLLSRHRTPVRRSQPLVRPVAPVGDEAWVREAFAAELERAKLDALKELAYGASHEINNPLANIALRAQTLLKREDDAEKRRALEAMHRGAMRAHEMISDLMLFARPPRLERQQVEVAPLVESACEEFARLAAQQSIELRVERDACRRCSRVDPVQLAVAVKAVVQNAIDAIGEQGAVEVRIACREEGFDIVVEDNGPGIPPEVRRHVFDPFFSGREAGRGLGFGLSKCWRIVTDHGGEVQVDASPLGGARFTLRFPDSSS